MNYFTAPASLPHYSSAVNLFSHRAHSSFPNVYANYALNHSNTQTAARLCNNPPRTYGFSGSTYTQALNILA